MIRIRPPPSSASPTSARNRTSAQIPTRFIGASPRACFNDSGSLRKQPSSRVSQRTEETAQLPGDQRRLLGESEMTAPLHERPALEVYSFRGDGARYQHHFLGENGEAGWDLDRWATVMQRLHRHSTGGGMLP